MSDHLVATFVLASKPGKVILQTNQSFSARLQVEPDYFSFMPRSSCCGGSPTFAKLMLSTNKMGPRRQVVCGACRQDLHYEVRPGIPLAWSYAGRDVTQAIAGKDFGSWLHNNCRAYMDPLTGELAAPSLQNAVKTFSMKLRRRQLRFAEEVQAGSFEAVAQRLDPTTHPHFWQWEELSWLHVSEDWPEEARSFVIL